MDQQIKSSEWVNKYMKKMIGEQEQSLIPIYWGSCIVNLRNISVVLYLIIK